jgi:hypothetical protein
MSIHPMIIDTPRRFGLRRGSPDLSSRLYWLNIDANIAKITFRRRVIADPSRFQPEWLIAESCVLQGLGTVANALSVEGKQTDLDQFVVDIASVWETEQTLIQTPDASARMVWSDIDPRSARLEIFIPHSLFRHLVEFYVTKRIDRVAMFMQIAVVSQPFTQALATPEAFPVLDNAGRLYFRQAQCDLLSICTALIGRDGAAAA